MPLGRCLHHVPAGGKHRLHWRKRLPAGLGTTLRTTLRFHWKSCRTVWTSVLNGKQTELKWMQLGEVGKFWTGPIHKLWKSFSIPSHLSEIHNWKGLRKNMTKWVWFDAILFMDNYLNQQSKRLTQRIEQLPLNTSLLTCLKQFHSLDTLWARDGQRGGDRKLSLPCLKTEWWKK